jgi:hypothetical protein
MLQYIGALVALIHLIFGTAMFSSLLYLGNGDAIPMILLFVAAAVISRVILQFEIGGMMPNDEERGIWRGIMQPLMREHASKGEGEGKGNSDGEGLRHSKNITQVAVRMTTV